MNMRNLLTSIALIVATGMIFSANAEAQTSTATSPAPAANSQSSSGTAATPKPKTATGTAKTGTTAAAPLLLKTDKDKQSYAIGVNIAKTMKKDGVEVNTVVVARAMRDVLNGAKVQMTDEEMEATLKALAANLKGKQDAKLAAVGAVNKTAGEAFLAANKSKEGVVALPSGLQYKILKAGSGPKPAATDSVVCNYKGTLLDGKEFDSSYKRGQPVTFPVSGVIKGWTEALQLMPVGSKVGIVHPRRTGLQRSPDGTGHHAGLHAGI